MEFFVNNIWAVPVFSLMAFLIIGVANTFVLPRNHVFSSLLTVLSTFVGLIFSSGAFIYCYQSNSLAVENTFSWFMVNSLSFDIGWFCDNFASLMLTMVCFISLLVQIFSVVYMEKDHSYNRFFAYLALFNFSMCAFILSPNLFQAYIFWELIGVCSYLLIGFWYKKESASRAAFKAFVINRIGDFGFFLGIIILGIYTFNYWISSSASFLSFSDLNMAVFYLHNIYGALSVFIVGCLFLLASIAKSAQFPLYVWLPDAMEAPTPVSALIHAATMVVAGVFLLARIYPLLVESPMLLDIIVVIGMITAILCAVFAIFEKDLKRILAYSTCSQLGYMFFALGIGAYSAALFHMFTHSFAKAMLFLCAGCVIWAMRHHQNIALMGGLRKKIPVIAYSFLIGTISLSGLFFSGFFSKEDIFHSLIKTHNPLLIFMFCILSVLSAFYMFRVYFLVFESKARNKIELTPIPLAMSMPVVLLALITAVFGFFASGGFGLRKFEDFISYSFNPEVSFSWGLAAASLLLAGLGVVLVYVFYVRAKGAWGADFWIEKFGFVYKIFKNKLYIDAFYEKAVARIFDFFSKTVDFFERFIINGAVFAVSLSTFLSSWILRLFHRANIGAYVVMSVGWLIFACILLYGFKVLLV